MSRNSVRVSFVLTELDLALTHCKLARERRHGWAHLVVAAHHAYDSVLQNMLKVDLTDSEFYEITANVELLKFSLESLDVSVAEQGNSK
jgi:hypothetical protein